MFLTAYHIVAYYGSLMLFGAASCAMSALCGLCGAVPGAARRERFVQRAIQREFFAFTRWLEFLRLLRIEYRGFERITDRRRIIVANHPSLLDAVFVIARVPTAVCIFKPSLRRNPMLGLAAMNAGYIPGNSGVGLVRAAIEKVAAGATLVVFPEGTRTPAKGKLGAFRPAFALVARLTGVPLQLIRISCAGELLTKERPCWKLPQLPARVVVEAGPCFYPKAAQSTAQLVAEVETWFRGTPMTKITPSREARPARPRAAVAS
jgi:1-acyl-sn-glycerol-3-phosphate acyltransferase